MPVCSGSARDSCECYCDLESYTPRLDNGVNSKGALESIIFLVYCNHSGPLSVSHHCRTASGEELFIECIHRVFNGNAVYGERIVKASPKPLDTMGEMKSDGYSVLFMRYLRLILRSRWRRVSARNLSL